MKYRKFGRDGVEVSEVGLGTWQLGGQWRALSDAEAHDVLSASVENGVTFFDTANIYGDGKSERRIREFMKNCDKDIFIATKLGREDEPGWPENFTLDVMRRNTEASLERLGVDSLDLTQLHCVAPEEMKKDDIFDNLRTLKQEGLIKRFGASVESMEEALDCLKQDGLYALQIIFNIFRQKPIDVLFEKAKEKNVALIVRLPLASGLLAGKLTKDTKFDEDDHRNYNRDGEFFNVGETFAGLPFEKGVELADAIKPLVPEGMTMAQFALRWILDFDAVSVVIPGATSIGQAKGNAQTSDFPPLPAETHEKLREFYKAEVEPHIRGKY